MNREHAQRVVEHLEKQAPNGDDWQLADACVVRSLDMYPHHEQRVGMRSGMMDAAHLCDAIAKEIGRGGRRSKHRDALIAVAKRCGDAIEVMRQRVEVPR